MIELRTRTRAINVNRWHALPLLLSLYLPSAVAQTPTPPAAAAQPASPAQDDTQVPTLSTHVDEVTLDMVVHDKKHRLVLDLKPEDFVVTDNDAPVTLSGLHLVKADALENAQHMITLVFDPFEGPTAKSAKLVADKVLKALPAKGYHFDVLDVRGRLRLIQGFTEDRKEVDQAVTVATSSEVVRLSSTHSQAINIATDKAEPARAKVAGEAEKNLISIARTGADVDGHHVDVVDRAREQTIVAALQDDQLIMQDQHAAPQLAALLALVKSQQRIGDRKAIIYFTQNAQMDSASKEMLKTIAGAATRAGVSIYTVDLDALNPGGRSMLQNALLNGQKPYSPVAIATSPYTKVIPQVQESGGLTGAPPTTTGPVWGAAQDIAQMTDFMRNGFESGDPFAEVKSPMAGLAKDTGGVYIDALNNLKKPLQEMVADLNTYYQATYVPPIKDYDGTFRAIQIKPVRAGLNVQTKSGYFALAPGADGSIRPFEAPLVKTLAATELPHDFNFHASVLRFGELANGNTNTLAVEIPLSEVQTKEDVHTNLFSAHVTIVAQVKDSSGVVVEHFGEDITRRGALESMDRDHTAAISLQRHFISAPGEYTMEVAVVDQNSGKASALRTKFEIADLAKTASLSDVVLVRKMDAVQEDEEDPVDPLRYEHGKVTPNISGELPDNAKGVSLFFMLHPDPAAHQSATLEMEVVHNGKAGRRTPLPLRVTTSNAAVPYLASFGSGPLAPGDYEVKAYLNQDGKSVEQHVSFSVAGKADAAVAANAGDGASPTLKADVSNEATIHAPGQLVITVPTNPVPPLSKDDARLLIEDARQRALGYNESLPNFMCIEVTNRSIDAAGRGRWKLQDTLVELLRYRDKNETHTMLEVNGKASSTDREGIKGALSAGEFGGVLKAVFRESAKANFEWKETDALNSGTVQVYTYRVERANSMFSVTGSNDKELTVGFHGEIYIDSATRSVRRVTLIADGLPKEFPTHATSIDVDYDYVAINAHDYLLPISAEFRLQQGRHEEVMNTIEFRNYKRFGSNLRILGYTPVGQQ